MLANDIVIWFWIGHTTPTRANQRAAIKDFAGSGEYDPGVRPAAVQELARGWKEHPETLAIRASKPQLALAAPP